MWYPVQELIGFILLTTTMYVGFLWKKEINRLQTENTQLKEYNKELNISKENSTRHFEQSMRHEKSLGIKHFMKSQAVLRLLELSRRADYYDKIITIRNSIKYNDSYTAFMISKEIYDYLNYNPKDRLATNDDYIQLEKLYEKHGDHETLKFNELASRLVDNLIFIKWTNPKFINTYVNSTYHYTLGYHSHPGFAKSKDSCAPGFHLTYLSSDDYMSTFYKGGVGLAKIIVTAAPDITLVVMDNKVRTSALQIVKLFAIN